ncbi:cytochrome c biogenesis ATP-binding export protein CcmA [bacterium BMS3Bbin10]|nr:cytochrome c biogenesis ATP-binding export protein CcmA [bacterium BMS3Bbin10]
MQLNVQDLACVRGGRRVFEGVSIRVKARGGVALTGPNGSGKSSLLRVLAGFIAPAAGTLHLEGGDDETPLGAQCHYVGHLNGVKNAFTLAENLAFWAEFLGGGDVAHALRVFGLEALGDIPAGLLSAGQARRLGLARLALAPRPLWLLDEPTVSLDAGSRKILAKVIREHMKGGGIVIVATHMPLGLRLDQELKLGASVRTP